MILGGIRPLYTEVASRWRIGISAGPWTAVDTENMGSSIEEMGNIEGTSVCSRREALAVDLAGYPTTA